MLNAAIEEALIRLREAGTDYVKLIEEQRFDLGIYQPVDIDPQNPSRKG